MRNCLVLELLYLSLLCTLLHLVKADTVDVYLLVLFRCLALPNAQCAAWQCSTSKLLRLCLQDCGPLTLLAVSSGGCCEMLVPSSPLPCLPAEALRDLTYLRAEAARHHLCGFLHAG